MLNRDKAYRPLPPGVEILPPGKEPESHEKTAGEPRRFPWTKIIIIGLIMLLYTGSPLDLIPDVIPVLGILDDLAIDTGLLALILKTVYTFYRGSSQARPMTGKSWLRMFFTRWVLGRLVRR